ncbi:hypothetical protein MUP38_08060 [Candidatus Bathyarchaeota archaeon]|nr:hypothetical protein [Candidatus Bathyarchaeota archaeon]
MVTRLSNSGMRSNYYGLIFILSVIGAILLIFTEFGGYTTYYQYSVNLESSFRNPDLIAYAPLFILVTFFFVLNIFLPLKELNIIKTSFPRNSAKLGFFSSLGILVITAVGGIAFEVILSESGAWNWWLNSGFYAGIICGIPKNRKFYVWTGLNNISCLPRKRSKSLRLNKFFQNVHLESED